LTKWPDKTRPNKYAKKPYAYEESEDDQLVLVAKQDMVDKIEQALDYLDQGNSTRKSAEWLSKQTGETISHQGLIYIWNRERGKGTANPSQRLKDLRKENRKRKPKTAEEKTLAVAKRKQADARRSLTIAKKNLDTLKPKEELDTANLDFSAIEEQRQEQEVVFAPNEGPQTEFLAANEREVLYGGAAGGW